MVENYLDQWPKAVQWRDEKGEYPLTIAAQNGNLPLVKYLVDHQANIYADEKKAWYASNNPLAREYFKKIDAEIEKLFKWLKNRKMRWLIFYVRKEHRALFWENREGKTLFDEAEKKDLEEILRLLDLLENIPISSANKESLKGLVRAKLEERREEKN